MSQPVDLSSPDTQAQLTPEAREKLRRVYALIRQRMAERQRQKEEANDASMEVQHGK